MSHRIDRRDFLKTSGAAAGFWIAGRQLGYGQEKAPNAKLNIAMIGTGGRGGANLKDVGGENIVALCDVNAKNVDSAAKNFPNAKKYADFRKLFDDAKDFDAVVVSTAEHTHAFATLSALKLGKHVYCEKPLTHGVWEARVIREAAAKAKVATQMGTQIHAGDNYRRVVEIVQSGLLGPIQRVQVWLARKPDAAKPWELYRGATSNAVDENDVKQLIELLRANPGKYSYASSGFGASPHLSAEWFKLLTKTDVLHVPFTGSAPALPALPIERAAPDCFAPC